MKRIPELDGLRGIAILLVLFYHFFWFPSPGGNWTGVPYWLWRFAQVGWVGVNIFFVLSGFLITRILISQKDEPGYFSRFYKRRMLRILPLYLVTLVFIYFYYPDSGKFVVLSLLFLAHVPELFQVKSIYPTLWSLSIEEQFYFVWPWVVRRTSLESLLKICMACCFIEPLIRGLNFITERNWPWMELFTSFDGFAFGAILALSFFTPQVSSDLLSKGKRFLSIAALFLLFLLPVGLSTRTRLIGEMFLPTSLYLIMGGTMAFCMVYSGTKYLRRLREGFLASWGKVSYGAYLCHYPVHEWVELGLNHFPWSRQLSHSSLFCLGRAVLSMAGTYFLSLALYWTVEEPFLRLKERQVKQ